ncbi:MAG: carboxypeptidase-like regulatory domain-containing protein [Isosphaeraceae bacterium]|nr:carboxypeptidase-like regulatory domain-containing protein [Isosphaeraceae bacterium]
MLERLNDARANPAAYGMTIGVDLSNVRAAEPLAFHPVLLGYARGVLPAKRTPSFWRMSLDLQVRRAGFPATYTGQCLTTAALYHGPDEAFNREEADRLVNETLSMLMRFPKAGNYVYRKQLLAITDTAAKPRRQAGIGLSLYETQPSGDEGSSWEYRFYAANFTTAADADRRAFVTGVVYRDENSNGKYDLGEGLGGVRISVSPPRATTTWDTGGYNLRLNPGTYTVTASGGELSESMTATVRLGRRNTRLDFALPANPPVV